MHISMRIYRYIHISVYLYVCVDLHSYNIYAYMCIYDKRVSIYLYLYLYHRYMWAQTWMCRGRMCMYVYMRLMIFPKPRPSAIPTLSCMRPTADHNHGPDLRLCPVQRQCSRAAARAPPSHYFDKTCDNTLDGNITQYGVSSYFTL